jgi:cellulose synthase/poly-beta-1,6-N-acetylglucosamine synthase-like glycosyltransferase
MLMHIWQYIFFFSCLAVLYNYAGYALLIHVLNRLKKKEVTPPEEGFFPTVSFIVAAFNEEDCMEKKIANSLAQDYPRDRIEFIFITDGSSDGTMDIIRRHPGIQLLHQPERKGKSAALNRAVGAASHDILIFSDANTFLNTEATRQITRHYSQERVGGVAGEKKVIAATGAADEVGATEGLYWKYESYLKQLDSDFYSVVGAAGELFSLRRNLYEPVPHKVILDDFIISMKVAAQGFRIVYEPGAYAMELPSFSIEDEQKRKIRIAAGGFQAMVMLRSLLLFWRQPRLSFLYISHRVLRWTLSPLCLMLAFISSLILSLGSGHVFFKLLFLGQLLLYGMALAANFIPQKNKTPKLMKLAYYFVFMNVSVVLGFFRFLRGKQPSAWEKAKRNPALVQTGE